MTLRPRRRLSSRQRAVQSRGPTSLSRRLIADRSRHENVPTTHRFPTTGRSSIGLGLRTSRWSTRKPWKCCHRVPLCPTKNACRRNLEAQLALALAQRKFACAEARDNAQKTHALYSGMYSGQESPKSGAQAVEFIAHRGLEPVDRYRSAHRPGRGYTTVFFPARINHPYGPQRFPTSSILSLEDERGRHPSASHPLLDRAHKSPKPSRANTTRRPAGVSK